MFAKFAVELQFRRLILGGLPLSKELVKQYVGAKFQSDDSTIVETDLDLEEETEKISSGFKKDETGIYIGDYAIKAALKQYASLLKLTIQKRGLKQTVKETLFVKGLLDGKLTDEKVYFQPLTLKPHGMLDMAGHVSTPLGQRSILKSAQYLEKPKIQFQVWVLEVRMAGTKDLNEADIRSMLELGQECGIGSGRSFEHGKFDVVSFEPIG